ncbi:MAG: mismatch-specific DNA-glycosylase [Dehalococcoidia bacterium]
MRTLPDLLTPRVDLVFVGINPGEESARRGHYYGHPGNAFWPLLSASGLTSRPVGPLDDRRLPRDEGIGFTDVVKRVVTDSTTVTDLELRASIPAFRRRIALARPRAICLTSSRAFDALFPRVRGSKRWGRLAGLDGELAGIEAWVMPSTSGRAAAYRGDAARVLGELAAHLGRANDLETLADRGAA